MPQDVCLQDYRDSGSLVNGCGCIKRDFISMRHAQMGPRFYEDREGNRTRFDEDQGKNFPAYIASFFTFANQNILLRAIRGAKTLLSGTCSAEFRCEGPSIAPIVCYLREYRFLNPEGKCYPLG